LNIHRPLQASLCELRPDKPLETQRENKSEIRSTKLETNSNNRNPNDRNKNALRYSDRSRKIRISKSLAQTWITSNYFISLILLQFYIYQYQLITVAPGQAETNTNDQNENDRNKVNPKIEYRNPWPRPGLQITSLSV